MTKTSTERLLICSPQNGNVTCLIRRCFSVCSMLFYHLSLQGYLVVLKTCPNAYCYARPRFPLFFPLGGVEAQTVTSLRSLIPSCIVRASCSSIYCSGRLPRPLLIPPPTSAPATAFPSLALFAYRPPLLAMPNIPLNVFQRTPRSRNQSG